MEDEKIRLRRGWINKIMCYRRRENAYQKERKCVLEADKMRRRRENV